MPRSFVHPPLLVLVLMTSSTAAWAQLVSNDTASEPGIASPTGSTASGRNASSAESESAATATTTTQSAAEDDDMVLDPAQPDFTVVNLPTSLRLPRHKLAFRVTHRFTRPLGAGDFGDLVEDFFGFDGGALIGLELRFGLWDGWQAGVYRTSNRTIAFFTQYNFLRQGRRGPFNLDAWVGVEGLNNFRDVHSPSVGAVVSRTFGAHAAVHVTPVWVGNTNPSFATGDDNESTLLMGLGGRVRVRPTVYLVGEFAPRVAGFDPGDHQISFGVEKRLGGHAFQLNFSNALGSTMGQVARSFANNDDWFIGFNISRKFY
jgi:hypothetical protein